MTMAWGVYNSFDKLQKAKGSAVSAYDKEDGCMGTFSNAGIAAG